MKLLALYRAVFPATADGSGSQTLEYRFNQYSVHTSFLYPKNVTIYKDGALWAKIDLLDFKGPSNAERSEGDGDSRDFIEQYLKWVR